MGELVIQPPLFPEPDTVPSPLCIYQDKPCPKAGRAVYGEPKPTEDYVNTPITCLTCGATGVKSENRGD